VGTYRTYRTANKVGTRAYKEERKKENFLFRKKYKFLHIQLQHFYKFIYKSQ